MSGSRSYSGKKTKFVMMKVPRGTRSAEKIKLGRNKLHTVADNGPPPTTRSSFPDAPTTQNKIRARIDGQTNDDGSRKRADTNRGRKSNPKTFGGRGRNITATQSTTAGDEEDDLFKVANSRLAKRSKPVPAPIKQSRSLSFEKKPKSYAPNRIKKPKEMKLNGSNRTKKQSPEVEEMKDNKKNQAPVIAVDPAKMKKAEDNQKKNVTPNQAQTNPESKPIGDDKEALLWQLKNGDSQSIFQDDGKGITAKSFVRKVMSEQGLQQLIDAFNQLETFPSGSATSAYTINLMKNRYNDIVCLDHRRVILRGMPECDYTHANYVDSYKQNKAFVCCQGPKESTVIDFWTMVWQENVRVVVMLTKTMETGREKCYEYWPLKKDDNKRFGNFDLTCAYFEEAPNFTQTAIVVRYGDETRSIAHLAFTAWPDYHIPENPLPFLHFLGHARKLQHNAAKRITSNNNETIPPLGPPMVIHCSAGVGRTGTFCAVDIGIRRLADVKRLDIIEIVKLLRTQRAFSIQKVDQFQFVNVCLVGVALHFIKETDKEKDMDEELMLDNMQKSLHQVVQQNPNTNDN